MPCSNSIDTGRIGGIETSASNISPPVSAMSLQHWPAACLADAECVKAV
jgi:hypothetical protein